MTTHPTSKLQHRNFEKCATGTKADITLKGRTSIGTLNVSTLHMRQSETTCPLTRTVPLEHFGLAEVK